MKFYLSAIILLLFMPTNILTEENQENSDFYYGFLNGVYDVIGRYPDSNQTYTGKVIFKKSHETLEVIRNINNNTIKASAMSTL